jgi:hypothetical protein
VRDNLIAALAILHAAAGLQPLPYQRGVRGLHFHKEDPVTTHKSCPGKNMVKADLVAAVQAEILRRHPGGGHAHASGEDTPATDPAEDLGLLAVKRRLKAMNYNPGILNGQWGGMTAGALAGFINDRGGQISPPASLDAFNQVRADIRSELQRAEDETPPFVRPVSEARASADPGTVATVAPEVVPAKRSFLATAWASIAAFFAAFWDTVSGYVAQAWDFFTDHKDDVPADSGWLQTAWDYVTAKSRRRSGWRWPAPACCWWPWRRARASRKSPNRCKRERGNDLSI